MRMFGYFKDKRKQLTNMVLLFVLAFGFSCKEEYDILLCDDQSEHLTTMNSRTGEDCDLPLDSLRSVEAVDEGLILFKFKRNGQGSFSVITNLEYQGWVRFDANSSQSNPVARGTCHQEAVDEMDTVKVYCKLTWTEDSLMENFKLSPIFRYKFPGMGLVNLSIKNPACNASQMLTRESVEKKLESCWPEYWQEDVSYQEFYFFPGFSVVPAHFPKEQDF